MKTWWAFLIFIAIAYVGLVTLKHLADKYKWFRISILVLVIGGICASLYLNWNDVPDPMNNPKNNPYFKCEYEPPKTSK